MIREDLKDKNRLYVGTDAGVYFSKDGGKKWEVLGDLPFVYVHDLAIHPRDNIIVIATHGRGMWVFDALRIDRPRKQESAAVPAVSAEHAKLLVGNWLVDSDAGYSFVLKFSAEQNILAGKLSFEWGEADLTQIRFDGKKLTFEVALSMEEQVVRFQSETTIEGEKITGTITSPWGKSNITGEKEKK